MLQALHISAFLIWSSKQYLVTVQSIKLPCSLIPLRHKQPPQHPILENAQPTFPNCEQPRFMHIQNKRENYSSVYLNFYISGE
jgi:hypothetical protein